MRQSTVLWPREDLTYYKLWRNPKGLAFLTIWSLYMDSSVWHSINRYILDRDEYRCRRCGCEATQCHHIVYYDRFREKRIQLAALCSGCNFWFKKNKDTKVADEANLKLTQENVTFYRLLGNSSEEDCDTNKYKECDMDSDQDNTQAPVTTLAYVGDGPNLNFPRKLAITIAKMGGKNNPLFRSQLMAECEKFPAKDAVKTWSILMHGAATTYGCSFQSKNDRTTMSDFIQFNAVSLAKEWGTSFNQPEMFNGMPTVKKRGTKASSVNEEAAATQPAAPASAHEEAAAIQPAAPVMPATAGITTWNGKPITNRMKAIIAKARLEEVRKGQLALEIFEKELIANNMGSEELVKLYA